jgi:hypothetical protein
MWNEEVGRFASSAALTPPPTLPPMDPLLWKRLRDELAGVNGRDGSASDARASRRALAADDREASAMALRMVTLIPQTRPTAETGELTFSHHPDPICYALCRNAKTSDEAPLVENGDGTGV